MDETDINIGKMIKSFIFFFFLALIVFGSWTIVPAGAVKVVTQLGKVTGRVLYPGLSFKLPIVESTLSYDTKKVIYEATNAEKQKGSNADYKDFPVDTNTRDGQQVDIYYTIRFSVDPTKATWIAQNIGAEDSLVEKVVKTDSRIWVRNIVRDFSAQDLYAGNIVAVQNLIEEKLVPIFTENGLILDEIGIREVIFDNAYIEAIAQKQIQAVKVDTEMNIASQAAYRKQARITEAEGMAKEQELQRQTITTELLQKMWIEKWKGDLPSNLVVGADQGQFILPLPSK